VNFNNAASLRVGIISDTHGFYHPKIPIAFDGVDCILHAGDVGMPEIVDALNTIAPTYGVFGNIDGAVVRRMLPEEVSLNLAGISVFMTHIGGRPGKWSPGVGDRLRQVRPDVFICGHSHILRIERIDRPTKLLYLNPGAAGRQGLHREKTCVVLTIDEHSLKKADVVHLDALE